MHVGWLSENRTRRPRPGLALLLCLTTLTCGFLVGSWDGRDSISTLTHAEALTILADVDAPVERRRNALGRLYALSECAALTFHRTIDDPATPMELRANAESLRRRLEAAWREN